MPFEYLPAKGRGRLIQGEVLNALYEYVLLQAPIAIAEGARVPVRAVLRERMVVMTQDCDLAQDFRLRSPNRENLDGLRDIEDDPGSVPSVLLCQAFDDLRPRVAGGDVFKRAKRNQDERYHTIIESSVPDGDPIPTLYLDFRKFVALSTPFLYEGLRSGEVVRLAVIPPVYLHDLIHRFFGYLSRVAVDAD